MNNGKIDIPDRCILPVSAADSLYILIEHRNHMGIMSPVPIPIVSDSLTYDFTVENSYCDSTSYGQINMGSKWAMFATDANQTDMPSYDIDAADKSIWAADDGMFDHYLPGDFNLDGEVNGIDKFLWKGNNGILSKVPK